MNKPRYGLATQFRNELDLSFNIELTVQGRKTHVGAYATQYRFPNGQKHINLSVIFEQDVFNTEKQIEAQYLLVGHKSGLNIHEIASTEQLFDVRAKYHKSIDTITRRAIFETYRNTILPIPLAALDRAKWWTFEPIQNSTDYVLEDIKPLDVTQQQRIGIKVPRSLTGQF